MQELLNSNMQQNLQLVVQVAKEYTEQLGADKIIELLEGVKSYHGLYYYLGSYLAFSEDPEVDPSPEFELRPCVCNPKPFIVKPWPASCAPPRRVPPLYLDPEMGLVAVSVMPPSRR